TGTTVLGNVDPSGIVEFTVLEGSACISYGGMGQTLFVQAGQMVVYDPIAMRLENPVDVDLQQQLNSPLVSRYRPLPSAVLLDEEIQSRRQGCVQCGVTRKTEKILKNIKARKLRLHSVHRPISGCSRT